MRMPCGLGDEPKKQQFSADPLALHVPVLSVRRFSKRTRNSPAEDDEMDFITIPPLRSDTTVRRLHISTTAAVEISAVVPNMSACNVKWMRYVGA
jgi:hypothetical protein